MNDVIHAIARYGMIARDEHIHAASICERIDIGYLEDRIVPQQTESNASN